MSDTYGPQPWGWNLEEINAVHCAVHLTLLLMEMDVSFSLTAKAAYVSDDEIVRG